jgi:SAM-dependent methyltransferase
MEKAASHWDQTVTAEDRGLILHYWQSPLLRELVDANWREATGAANSAEQIRSGSGRQSFGLGISIGCGSAEDEISLLEHGVLDRLIVCDISTEQLDRAEAVASARGIDPDRLIRRTFVDQNEPLPEKVDLFYWRQSLHHMLDTERTLLWCRDNLTDDGAIYCNDACPPDYMQWDSQVLDFVELFRSSLPREYMRDPLDPAELLPNRPKLPNVDHWMAIDPTECANSSAIIPAIRKNAPKVEIAFLGGCIYGLALDDIINNFRSEDDLPLLKNAMLFDRLMSMAGMNQFFACVINKRDFI